MFLDLPPKPLWTPPKPAILRPAEPGLIRPPFALSMLPGFCIVPVISAASVPPSWVSTAAANDSPTSPVSVNLPSGRDANSITIIVATCVWASGSAPTLSIGSGTSFAQINNTADAFSLRVAWLRGSAGSTVSLSASGGGGIVSIGGYCMLFSGCVTSGDPTEGANTTNGGSSSTTHTSPSTVTTGANRLGVRIWARGTNTTSTLASGWTERADGDDVGNNSSAAYTKTIAAAGTEAAASATAASSCAWACQGFALIPA